MKLAIGIIGLGKMGAFHYKTCKENPDIGKIYLVDPDKTKIQAYSEDTFLCYKELIGKADLVIISSPTNTHFEIASFFLKNKIPVLIEKPIAENTKKAKALLELAKKKKTFITVGHVERYNSAYLAIKKIIKNPKFIECHRLSPYPYRSLDVGVVLDLMIHDLDIILDIVRSDVKKIDATGIKVLSNNEDIANARITFKNGCIANVTASRISKEQVRKFRVFLHNHYISLDYANQKVEIYQKVNNKIESQFLPIDKEQPLKKELQEFIWFVKRKKFSIDSARNATEALDLALKIQKQISK